jgi:prepilin-type N-terminal cleavage/methylation domain-containing protein
MKISNQTTSSHNTGLRASASAFTLIELMVVIAIILVLATMTVVGLGWYKRKAAEGKTTVLVSSIARGLEEYRLDNGFFPHANGGNGSTEQVYIALYGDGNLVIDGTTGNVTIGAGPTGTPDSENKVYLSILDPDLKGNKLNVDPSTYTILDAWGTELQYRSPGEMNPADDFDLWSLGPDGKGGPNTGTEKQRLDDIKNY